MFVCFKRSHFGTSALNPGVGFLRIFTVAFDRLGQLRNKDCPAGLENWPAGLRPPAGTRKRRKASVTKRRNTSPGFNTPDTTILIPIWGCNSYYKI